MSDAVLFEVQRNARERLRVTSNVFKGKTFVHVRLYFEGESGEWLPGNKGIALRVNELEGVIDALTAVTGGCE